MLNRSPKELKAIPKIKGIKGYKNMSEVLLKHQIHLKKVKSILPK